MKNIVRATLALVLGAGAALVAVPLSATAVTVPDEYCQAVYETQPNPDYVPEVPEVSHVEIVVDSPEVPEISHTEYLYKQLITGKEKWRDSLTWNPGLGWYYAHETRVVIDQAYQPAVTHEETIIDQPYQAAIGEPTIEVNVGSWCELTVNWQTTFLTADPQDSNDVSWPQSFLGLGTDYVPACGVQVQQDDYEGWREDIDAVLADDSLHGSPIEDSAIVQSWRFLDGGVCAPETPEPLVTYSEWTGGEVSCDVPDGEESRTVTTTTYTVVGDPHTGWTIESSDEVVTETRTIHYDGDCTVEEEEPPVTESPKPVVPVATPTDELAETGAFTSEDQLLSWIAVASLALAVGAAILGLVARRRARRD